MRTPRADIVSARRQQIVEAAVAIIAQQGLPNLSLSEIEQKAGMSRGQLTYYFPTKEAILLAVFDHLLVMMCDRAGAANGEMGSAAKPGAWLQRLETVLKAILQSPPISPAFHCLQYTFLSQIGYREDFRQRLANLYEEWRGRIGRDVAADLAERRPRRPVSARALASLIQALLHGLTVQLAADPEAFEPAEMVNLCLDMLATYLKDVSRPKRKLEGGRL
jgi:AcrR family transcriptional regulator